MQAMLSSYGEAQGDYNEVFRRLLTAPRSETGTHWLIYTRACFGVRSTPTILRNSATACWSRP